MYVKCTFINVNVKLCTSVRIATHSVIYDYDIFIKFLVFPAQGWSGCFGGMIGYGAFMYSTFPDFFGPEPSMIWLADQLI